MNTRSLHIAFKRCALAAALLAYAPAAFSAAAGTLKATPTKVNFKSETVLPPLGVSSVARVLTLTVSKKAPGPVTIQNPVSSDPQFTVTQNGCNAPVQPGGTCKISLVFTPEKAGLQPANLAINSNASNPTINVPLSGTGKPGSLVYTPRALSFGTVNTGAASKSLTVTLTNKNPIAMSVQNPELKGNGFSVVNNTCGANLAASGGSCGITVVFQSFVPGKQQGALTLNDNAAKSPQTVNLIALAKGSAVPTPTPTQTPAAVPTATATATATATSTANGTPTATATASVTATATTSPTPTPTAVASPTAAQSGAQFPRRSLPAIE